LTLFDLIDVQKENASYEHATILDMRQNKEFDCKEFLIGFRV